MLNETRAYIAGLFDGEGCVTGYIATTNTGIALVLRATIVNTSLELLESVQNELGFGKVRERKQKESNRKKVYELDFGPNGVKKLREVIMPYLRLKNKQMEIAAEIAETIQWGRSRGAEISKEEWEKRYALLYQLKTLNFRGIGKQPLKFGGTANVSGERNTEPSLSNEEGVTTKQAAFSV